MELPKSKLPAETQDPRNLIIFSKVKQGKSSALAELPNNLMLDTEGGLAYIEALKVRVTSVKDIKEVCQEVIKAGKPYDFITIDTVTALEDIVKPLALHLYKQTPAGEKFTGTDVIDAAMGAGYKFMRDALEQVINMVAKCTRNVILVCHAKDAAIANSDLTAKQIDLLGKTGRILASKSDAIGYLYRDDESNTILSFNTNDKFVECGARPAHLRNKDVVLGKYQEDGTVVYDWTQIYPSLRNA